jgi:hypothetical protein
MSYMHYSTTVYEFYDRSVASGRGMVIIVIIG